jgi:hypothetical protein
MLQSLDVKESYVIKEEGQRIHTNMYDEKDMKDMKKTGRKY